MKINELYIFEGLRRGGDAAFKPSHDLVRLSKSNPNAWSVILGTYLGYPPNSILGFLKRSVEMERMIDQGMDEDEVFKMFPFPDSPFIGTGFLPFGSDSEVDPEKLLKMINRRRFHSEPMTLEPYDRLSKNVSNDVYRLAMSDQRFHNRCVKNLKFVMKEMPSFGINLTTYQI